MIENSKEVHAYLAARYPHAEVKMFDFGEHPNMTMPEQVGAQREAWPNAASTLVRSVRRKPGIAAAPVQPCSVGYLAPRRLLTHALLPAWPAPLRCLFWQVKLMSDTSILVTPCGGLATVLAFMRPGATAIAMNFWHTLYNRSMQLENNYYQ